MEFKDNRCMTLNIILNIILLFYFIISNKRIFGTEFGKRKGLLLKTFMRGKEFVMTNNTNKTFN